MARTRSSGRKPDRPRPGVRLVRMSPAEFVAFQVRSIRGYAGFQVASGWWPRRGARRRAAELIRQMLPQGLNTPGHHCWRIEDRLRGQRVGHLWVAETDTGGRLEAFVYDIEIDPEERKRGYATAVFRLFLAWARRRRVKFIRLRVHAHNEAARALYEKLGFAPTDLLMALPVKVVRRRRTMEP